MRRISTRKSFIINDATCMLWFIITLTVMTTLTRQGYFSNDSMVRNMLNQWSCLWWRSWFSKKVMILFHRFGKFTSTMVFRYLQNPVPLDWLQSLLLLIRFCVQKKCYEIKYGSLNPSPNDTWQVTGFYLYPTQGTNRTLSGSVSPCNNKRW